MSWNWFEKVSGEKGVSSKPSIKCEEFRKKKKIDLSDFKVGGDEKYVKKSRGKKRGGQRMTGDEGR